jgi:hypothetical protein
MLTVDPTLRPSGKIINVKRKPSILEKNYYLKEEGVKDSLIEARRD